MAPVLSPSATRHLGDTLATRHLSDTLATRHLGVLELRRRKLRGCIDNLGNQKGYPNYGALIAEAANCTLIRVL